MVPPPELLLGLEQLPDPLPVPPLAAAPGKGGSGPFVARIRPPGSKSLTNRALLLAALADGESLLRRPLLQAADTEVMIAALRTLGADITRDGGDLRIRGVASRWRPAAAAVELNLGGAGTAVRFLAAAALLCPVPVSIDGDARMRQRPIGDLADALQELGARVEWLDRPGFPPLRIHPSTRPGGIRGGDRLEVGPVASSQFVSALLLTAPFIPSGLTLLLDEGIPSRSYIQTTLGLLDSLGASVKTSDTLSVVRIAAPSARLHGFEYHVEPDASSATYFWAAAAMHPGTICRVEGLDSRSLQGDSGFAELLSRMGATVLREEGEHPSIGIRGPASLDPIIADMLDMPDAAMTLAAAACFAGGRSIIRGLKTLRIKESDRIAALQNELNKIGVGVEVSVLGDPDAITILPPRKGVDCSSACARVEFDTYNDHRMAMALALIGLRRPNVWIRNPRCIAKTYPEYWRDLARLY